MIEQILTGRAPLRLTIHNFQGEAIGHLAPVTVVNVADDALAETLTRWRNQNASNFFTQFVATPARTKRWLQEVVVKDPTRLLFLVYTRERLVGHMGFVKFDGSSAEGDNQMRGERGGGPNLFYFAHIALFDWMFGPLGVERIWIRVLGRNANALVIHSKLGFRVVKEVQAYVLQKGEERCVSEEPDPASVVATESLLTLELCRGEYYAKRDEAHGEAAAAQR